MAAISVIVAMISQRQEHLLPMGGNLQAPDLGHFLDTHSFSFSAICEDFPNKPPTIKPKQKAIEIQSRQIITASH